MAQNMWINVTMDGHATTQEGSQHAHSGGRGASASGDLTVSLDTTKVTNFTRLKWALDTALKIARQGKELVE